MFPLHLQRGSLLKVDRFGLVKRAMHGSKMMSPAEIRAVYGRDLVHLAQSSRWVFLNTLFSVSEGCMYTQARPCPLNAVAIVPATRCSAELGRA